MSSPTVAPADELLTRALLATSDAVFCETVDGDVVAWSTAAERLYGVPAAEMVGRQAALLVDEASQEEMAAARAAALMGAAVGRFDCRHRRADGSVLDVSASVVPLLDGIGRVDAIATTVTEIGDRVRLAEELAAARDELERNNEALRRSNRDLEQFAYVASHDLSEPLRVMTGYVTQLERRYDDVLDERGRRYMQHIVEASARMRALIDDLLEYASHLRAPRRSAPVELGPIADAVVTLLGAAIADAGGTVEVGPLPAVRGDERQLQSLLQNLISNAVKFAHPGRAPQVVVTAVEERGTVTLRVDDNGIGIEPEYRERVFRMFQRLHVREAYIGNGIGLAIAQQVVELSGGRIWVEDSPLGGTRIACTLPSASTS